MANNHEGGIKTRDKMLAQDPDFYKKIGVLLAGVLAGEVKQRRQNEDRCRASVGI